MANLGYIQITRICDQECRFCSNPANGRIINFNEAKKILDGYISLKYRGVIWTGGEPTLYPRLGELIAYAKEKGIHSRIITNGQRLSEYHYFKKLAESGLGHANFSLFSHKPEIHDFLTQKKGSYVRIIKAIENSGKLGIGTHVNTVINKYNCDHLSEMIMFIVKKFPFVNHFIFNNIDPLMNRASHNNDTIPQLNDFELELFKAMRFLEENGKTFRVERVPLCYMVDYAHCSTETRKIVKKEERSVHFLDEKRGRVRQKKWEHGKAACCAVCSVNGICAGLWQIDVYYSSKELHPVFIDPEMIKKRVLSDSE